MCSRQAELTEEHLIQLFAIAKRMALRWCTDADADDVAQEALVRLLRQGSMPANVPAWLYVVTRRIWNRTRLRSLTRLSAESAYEPHFAHSRADPDLFLDVRSVLSRLPARDRRLLLLVLAGVRSADIASELGCKERDIGQMVARARRKARKLLVAAPSTMNHGRKEREKG
jgi:RNA polymerase sigma factor (sigma-70 family)